MYQIKTLNKIAQVGLNELPAEKYTVTDDAAAPDGVLVRSADMVSAELPESLLAIARAGAGTNNIPIDRCSEAGVVVFNTPGANANAVKELTICALLLASRRVAAGNKWLDEQAANGVDVTTVIEKGKSQFVGPELQGKTLGVIGLGAIGVQVANIATKLGMNVVGYDPFLSVNAALSLSRAVRWSKDIETVWKESDYLTLHLPQNEHTKGIVGKDAIAMMKDGVRIVNLARGGLVDKNALIPALESGKVASYVTDFPDNDLLKLSNVTGLPHLGASTPESEDNCAVMAARQLADYLENGNIVNSVNLPAAEMPWSGTTRLCIIHRNGPGILSGITSALSQESINVENMVNKSKGDYAYTIVDVNASVSPQSVAHISGLDNILRVRVLTR